MPYQGQSDDIEVSSLSCERLHYMSPHCNHLSLDKLWLIHAESSERSNVYRLHDAYSGSTHL
jgi:hypothetical protein